MDTSRPAAPPDHRTVKRELLRMFLRELGETLRPELSSAYARNVAELLLMMLDHMADWEAGGDAEIDRARLALAAGWPVSDMAARPLLPELDDAAGADGALAASIAQAAAAGDTAGLALLIPGAAAIDDRLYEAENRRHAESRREDAVFMAEHDVEVTGALFDRYAAARLDIRDDPTRSVVKIPGGNSKDTFLVTLASGSDFIIRRDFPFGPTETSAPDEFGLLNRLNELGLPVARPIAAEYDRRFLGQPFLLVEKVAGVNAHGAGMADPETGRFVAFELARILARLHRIDPLDAGFAVTGGAPRDQIAAYLAGWRRWWDRNRLHPSSLGEAAFAWLERNIPEDVSRIVIVHGDARPENMLFEDGRITALLDWEFAHPGDPAEDLQYAKGFVQPFCRWEEFLDAYLSAGGAPVSEAGSRFYDVFRSLRNMMCTDVSWSGFVRRDYPAFKLASQGVVHKRVIAHALAKSLMAVSA